MYTAPSIPKSFMDPKLINVLPTSPEDVVDVEDRTGVGGREGLTLKLNVQLGPFPLMPSYGISDIQAEFT